MGMPVLIIACGAIARELVQTIAANDWHHIEIQCLDPNLHNRPQQIPDAIEKEINAASRQYDQIFVAFADCGTGGQLDALLAKHRIERLPGAHCYEFFAGNRSFAQLAETEPASFYLTDFLVRHFDRLIKQGLGLDRHPELLPQYFGNYRRLVYLAQTRSPRLQERAREHANYLGLQYHYCYRGLDPLAQAMQPAIMEQILTAAARSA